MKKLKKLFILILSSILCTTFFACAEKGSAVDFYYFNTVIHAETHDFAISNQTKTQLDQLFSSLQSEFNGNNQNSAVYTLNQSPANVDVAISSTAMDVFTISKNLFEFTNKKFNPAIFPLVKLWQFDNYPEFNFAPPSNAEVLSLLGENINFENVVLNADALTVKKTEPNVQVDFGGILKGYAVDKAFEILINAGHNSGYINVGGSSLRLLKVNSLSIRHPRATKNIDTLINFDCKNLQNVAVSTSGDYEKYYTYQGTNYSHIISGETGYPTDTGVISATVIGATGALGDAVTTAMCLMEHNYGETNTELITFINKLINQFPDVAVFAVFNKDGKSEIITNKTQGEHFTLLDDSYSINKI